MQRLFLILFFLIGTYSENLSAQVPYSDISLEFGQHEIAYQHLSLYDSTRAYQHEMNYSGEIGFRPISISMWYPSQVYRSEDYIEVEDYLEIIKREQEWEHLPNEYILDWFGYNNTAQSRLNIQQRSRAVKNGKAKTGKYPVILYAPSYQASSTENFMLCEYLASQGFVVLATPSKGAKSVFLQGGSVQDASAQNRDIEYLLAYANKLSQADLDRVFLVGFSFGGLSNVLTAMQHRTIDGLISLDGTIKYRPNVIAESPWHDLNQFKIPFIHFSQKDIPTTILDQQDLPHSINHEFQFFDQINGLEKYEFKLKHLSHGYFSSFGMLFYQRDDAQDKSYAEIAVAYSQLCEATLKSLQYMIQVKEENRAWKHQEYLGLLGLPSSFELVNFAVEASAKDLFIYHMEEARKNDFSKLDEVYQVIKQKHKDYLPPEGKLNTLGLQLIFKSATFEMGEKIFLFALEVYPKSANLHDSLAEGYRFQGKKKLAIKHFELSLTLYPGNANASKRLEELKK